ncbi:hypothetical protein ACX93W_26860 [Paenibacillus sp. CAU 1782]
MENFWSQIWKQHDRIKNTRGEVEAGLFLKNITQRLSDISEFEGGRA